MEVLDTFDRLVTELSDKERKRLLEKIKQVTKSSQISESSSISMHKLQDVGNFEIDGEIKNLNFFTRLIIQVVSFFTGKSLETVLKESHLKKVKRAVNRYHPGLVNFKDKVFLSPFKERLVELQSSINFFKEIMECAFGKRRESFVAFIAASLLEDLYSRIRVELDPEMVAGELGTHDRVIIKREIEGRLKNILNSISDLEKKKIEGRLLPLYSLYRLCQVDLKRIVNSFKRDSATGSEQVSFLVIKDTLFDLANRLNVFFQLPGLEDLQSLYLFCNSDFIENKDSNFNNDLARFLSASSVMLERILVFKSNMPLVDLISVIIQDPSYRPKSNLKYDSYLQDLKAFWNKWIILKLKSYMLLTERNNMLEDIKEFLNGKELTFLENYQDELYMYRYSLGLIYAFCENLFIQMLKYPLDILYLNGDFYKESNRKVFTDSYNWFIGLEDKLEQFEKKLAQEGMFKEEFENIDNELLTINLKRKKKEIIAKKVDSEAEKIIQETMYNASIMIKVLEGILYGEVGGEFDTIANFGTIGGRGNKKLISAWKKGLSILDVFVKYLDKMYKWEKSYRQNTIDSITLL